VLVAAMFLCSSLVRVYAKDLGILIDQTPAFEWGESMALRYSGTVMPWFSSPLGENMDLYLAAGLTFSYENKTFDFVPELLRTQLDLRLSNTAALKVGRIYHADPLELIAEGLFDGLSLGMDLGDGDLNFGLYYTGFLYKKSINITITPNELYDYTTHFTYSNFADTYFAPSRLVFSLGWAHPALADLFRLNLELLGQFDLNGLNSTCHSQYLAAKLVFPFKNRFVLETGGVVELIETSSQPVKLGLAGDLNFSYMPPTAIQDRITLGGRWSSGTWAGGILGSFIPITTETQGHILRAKFSGLSSITASYTARLHETFSAMVDIAYFMRSDLGTYEAWPLSGSSKPGYLLGAELYAQLIWSPLSDVSCRLGGGAFFPGLGNASPREKPHGQVQLNIVVSVF
jgi:hypothetical protein